MSTFNDKTAPEQVSPDNSVNHGSNLPDGALQDIAAGGTDFVSHVAGKSGAKIKELVGKTEGKIGVQLFANEELLRTEYPEKFKSED